jgi:uncharacterized protein (TIGR01777 family)
VRIVVPGGTGNTGRPLVRHLLSRGHQVTVLTRSPSLPYDVEWGGRTVGAWASLLDGADAVINLAGRSVNCRPTEANHREMMESRTASTRAVGEAIAQAARPPRVWLNASTATIYAHTFGLANDDLTGTIGGGEPDAPRAWDFSVEIAKRWEAELFGASTPGTRRVAMRSAMTMSSEPGSVFTVFVRLARLGLFGRMGSGRQFVSWVHGDDFMRAVEFLLEGDLEGPVNIASPNPLPMEDFARAVRQALGVRIALPATAWMLKIGTRVVGSDDELVLKSRRVVPKRLTDAGFRFDFLDWPHAAKDLVERTAGR